MRPKFPTKKAFFAWRKKHPRIGVRRSASSCPVALYLQQHGFRLARVGSTQWYSSVLSDVARKLPMWAQDFIVAFDKKEPE